MELVKSSKLASKTARSFTHCGSLYTIGDFDTKGRMREIRHEFSKSGACMKTNHYAHAISHNGNLEAEIVINKILHKIENGDIAVKGKEDTEDLIKQLKSVAKMCDIKTVASHLMGCNCGMDERIENGEKSICCIDAMAQNIIELTKKGDK